MTGTISRLVLAIGVILSATTAAHADIISPIIALFSFISTAISSLGTIGSILLSSAASIGLSYLAKALAPKPSQQSQDITSLPGGTTGKLQAGGSVPRSFIVGRAMTAGSLVYANTYSPAAAKTAAAFLSQTTAASGNTPNAYLVQVIALSDIPVTGLAGLFVGNVAATYNSGATPSFEGIAIPEYAGYLWIRFYDGTQIAADPQLVALFATDPNRPYTNLRAGNGISYAVVTSLVNQDKFPSFPQFKFVLDGVKFYDRRYDTSVGGSGSQRWSTPSTWALSRNPIVIAENILRGISYGGKWVYGAQTVAAAQLPSASWTAAASECDSAIALAGGGTEPQFTAGGEIRFDVEPANTLEEMLKACNGRMAEIGGTYKVRAGAPGSAVFSFTDGDILSTEQQTFDPFPSLGQTINAVTGKYISPAEGWVAKDAPPLYDATLEAADGGRRQAVDVNYSFVTSGTQVQRLMRSERDTHRAMRNHILPMPPEAFVLEPLDVVSWSSARNNYSAKLFEISSAEDLPNFNMGLSVKEIDPNAYNWTAGTDERPVTDGTIVIVRPQPQPIVAWNAVPWVILSDDNRHLPGIKLSWDPATVDVNGVRFEVRIKSTGEVVTRGETDSWAIGSIIISHNMVSNTVYQTRGQYRPVSARDVTWSDWLDVSTPDVRIPIIALEAGLKDYVANQLKAANDAVNKIEQLIASIAADQDAANWLDKTALRNTISAREGVLNASISTVSVVAANTQAAFASYQITTNASLGSISATASQALSSVATVDGKLAATAQLTTNVGNKITGLKIYNNGITGTFDVEADYFNVGKTGVAGGTFVPVFQVAAVGGIAKVSFRGDMFADGTITAKAMNVSTLDAITGNVGRLTSGKIADAATDVSSHLIIDLANATITGQA